MSDSGVVLDRLGVLFSGTATVAQVNQVLADLEGEIAYARSGSLLLTLSVPPQSAPGDMEAIAARLQSAPGVLAAWPERTLRPLLLPAGADGRAADPFDLRHLLPTRFPAAWNATGLLAGCESRPVPVVVLDWFDEAVPAEFFSFFPAGAFTADPLPRPPAPRNFGLHGYRVTLAIAAAHDANAPTGAHPRAECLQIESVDVSRRGDLEDLEALRGRLVSLDNEKVVVQASLGGNIELCGENGDAECDSQFGGLTGERLRSELARRVARSLAWARIGLNARFRDQILFSVSAGNEADDPLGVAYPGFRDARFSLFPQAVAHLPILRQTYADESFGRVLWTPVDAQGVLRLDLPGAHLATDQLEGFQSEFDALDLGEFVDLRNVITVGAIRNQFPDIFPATALELTRSRFSNDEAMLHAVGENISLGVPDPVTDSVLVNGTSFSAPQVAGLAAYLWLLSDELRALPVAETKRLISATAQRSDSLDNIVDAYAAVLALDRPGEPKRIRLAILDVNGDGRFTEADIQRYLDAFEQFEAQAPEEGDPVPDFSRFDLNGDGVTGGVYIMPMDLDGEFYTPNGAPILESIGVNIEGVRRTFDERAVTDLEVLCFFAYDPLLYGGSRDARRDLLAERCVPPLTLESIFPQLITGRGPLSVLVRDGDGDAVPDVLVRFTSSCGVLYDSDGLPALEVNRLAVRSNAQGVADVAVAVDEGTACTNRVSVSVEAVLEDDPDTVVARTSVSALVLSGATPSLFGSYVGTHACTVTSSTGFTSNCSADREVLVLGDRFNAAGNLCGREVCISPPRGCRTHIVFAADIMGQSPSELRFTGSASTRALDITTDEQVAGRAELDSPPRIFVSFDGEERFNSSGTQRLRYSCTFVGEQF